MFKKIIEDLAALLTRAEAKEAQLERDRSAFAQTLIQHAAKDADLQRRITEFATKSAKYDQIDGFFDLEKRARELWQDSNNKAEDLRQAKETFEAYKSGELKKIAEDLKQIAAEWKKLRGE